MRTFTLTVRVDQGNVNPIDIVTEPPLEGRPLAEFVGWLAPVRSELKDGEYVLKLGALEGGLHGEGSHERSVQTLRTRLFAPMADTLADLNEAYGWRDADDDTLVAEFTDQVADQMAALGVSPDAIKPGFLSFQVVCPTCGPSLSIIGSRVADLEKMELPDEERPLRDSALSFFRDTLGIAPKSQPTPVAGMVFGAPCRNPFSRAANARYQERVVGLLPRVESAVVGKLLGRVEDRRARDGSFASALRERFNLA